MKLIKRKIGLYFNYILYKIKYRHQVKFNGFTIIYEFPNSKIRFGKNITINSSFFSNFVGINHPTILIARDGGEIEIGNGVGISGATIYSLEKIEIGNNVLIGGNVTIIDNDFHPLDPEKRKLDDRIAIKRKPIKIGDNVFIGMNSTILRGTKIGENSIVGAGSVVKGEFPDNCVIGGNPAKVLKMLLKE